MLSSRIEKANGSADFSKRPPSPSLSFGRAICSSVNVVGLKRTRQTTASPAIANIRLTAKNASYDHLFAIMIPIAGPIASAIVKFSEKIATPSVLRAGGIKSNTIVASVLCEVPSIAPCSSLIASIGPTCVNGKK